MNPQLKHQEYDDMLHIQQYRIFQEAVKNMENDRMTIKKGKSEKLGEKPASVHFINQEFHMKSSGIESKKTASNRLSSGAA
jgi:hypothetical protein